MLRSALQLKGYRLEAVDGELGNVSDFLFDDERWVVRYLVADTRRWLPGNWPARRWTSSRSSRCSRATGSSRCPTSSAAGAPG